MSSDLTYILSLTTVLNCINDAFFSSFTNFHLAMPVYTQIINALRKKLGLIKLLINASFIQLKALKDNAG